MMTSHVPLPARRSASQAARAFRQQWQGPLLEGDAHLLLYCAWPVDVATATRAGNAVRRLIWQLAMTASTTPTVPGAYACSMLAGW